MTAATSPTRAAVRVGVGFADLSGFTGLTESLTMSELSQLLTGFEEVAEDIVRGADGRVVKFIGDAVMYVTHDALAAVQVAQGLIRRRADPRDAGASRRRGRRSARAAGRLLRPGREPRCAAGGDGRSRARCSSPTRSSTALGGAVATDALGARAVRGFTQEIEVARLR